MTRRLFEGLKVLDFTWAAAGPITTKHLADGGATVVKVESSTYPDSVRLGGPYKDNKPGINRSGFFADFNTSKQGIALDMKNAAAKEVILDLACWADVVADSFRPGVLGRSGLGYDVMRERNPGLITLSTSLYGSDGPYSNHPGFGAQGAALSGIHGQTGWPDRAPAAPKGAYTDSIAPRFALAALSAALIHRERTGVGQHIEISQIESGVQFLAPELLQYQLDGVAAQRHGNDAQMAVHGAFPTAGSDCWIAIDATSDQSWTSLQRFFADRGDPRLEDFDSEDRVLRMDAVHAIVGQLTAGFESAELARDLQKVGVATYPVNKGSDLMADPVLRDSEHFTNLDHPEMGRLDYNGPAYRFQHSTVELRSAAPCLGEHTHLVLGELLGYDEQQISALEAAGALR
ncbi:CaiB/BaiF CoA transferase family protein [Nocardioides sp.]|uniref:CaiB/BaiF CoA transferase family protein n=1 Tax=Nocardioides sp. TaxID=35761 RepID=UPI003D0D2AB1